MRMVSCARQSAQAQADDSLLDVHDCAADECCIFGRYLQLSFVYECEF